MGKKIIGESGLKVIFYIEGVEHPDHELFSMEDLLPTEYNLKKAMESCKKMGYKVTCDPIRPKTVKINRHKEYKQKKMIIDIIKKANRQSQSLITGIDMDFIYGLYLQYYLENDNVEVLDSKELEKEIKKSGFDVRDGKIVRNEQFKQLIKVKT